jgi:hypothetical protein
MNELQQINELIENFTRIHLHDAPCVLYTYGMSTFRFLQENMAVAAFTSGSFFISTSSTRTFAPKSGGSAVGIPRYIFPGSQYVATATVLSTIVPKYSALPVTALG